MAREDKGEDRPTHNLDESPNPVWFKPIMLGFLVLGLIWIIVFYLSDQQFPIPGIGSWNLVAGFGIVLIGFLMTMRWRS